MDDRAPATLHPRDVRKALRKSDLVDPFLCCRFSFSPYMACGHGCLYCDGRAEKYWVEGDFERDIVVRRNLPQLLRSELARLRERAPVAIGSGISDAYQPVERTLELTRECAAVLADAPVPVSLLTKSALVQRDLDLWTRVHRGAFFILNLTIATLDDSVRARYEPGASRIDERLKTLRAFADAGIPVGVMALPLLPFISDSEQDIRALLAAAREAGATFIMPGGLTLRPGRQKEHFMALLAANSPGLVPRYRMIYGEDRPSGSCTREYRDELNRRIRQAVEAVELPFLLPHAVYADTMPIYDEIYLLLQHMQELYRERRVPVSNLSQASRRYAQWLLVRKKAFNRRRSVTQQELEQETIAVFSGDEARQILGNERLAIFLREVVLHRKKLDYRSLTLS